MRQARGQARQLGIGRGGTTDDADLRRFYFGEWTLAKFAKKRRGGEAPGGAFSPPSYNSIMITITILRNLNN